MNSKTFSLPKAGSLFRLALIVLFLSFGLSGCSKMFKSGAKPGDPNYISDEDLELQQQQENGGNVPTGAENGLFQDIHFDYDSASISSENMEILRKNAEFLVADPSLHAEVEGHCDRRGTSEYNMALGDRRAKEVSNALVSFGAQQSQLSTISYGEEVPVDPADNDAAYATNRRVHFALYRKK
jgi:peptidoglycan-associated lipoprotein